MGSEYNEKPKHLPGSEYDEETDKYTTTNTTTIAPLDLTKYKTETDAQKREREIGEFATKIEEIYREIYKNLPEDIKQNGLPPDYKVSDTQINSFINNAIDHQTEIIDNLKKKSVTIIGTSLYYGGKVAYEVKEIDNNVLSETLKKAFSEVALKNTALPVPPTNPPVPPTNPPVPPPKTQVPPPKTQVPPPKAQVPPPKALTTTPPAPPTNPQAPPTNPQAPPTNPQAPPTNPQAPPTKTPTPNPPMPPTKTPTPPTKTPPNQIWHGGTIGISKLFVDPRMVPFGLLMASDPTLITASITALIMLSCQIKDHLIKNKKIDDTNFFHNLFKDIFKNEESDEIKTDETTNNNSYKYLYAILIGPCTACENIMPCIINILTKSTDSLKKIFQPNKGGKSRKRNGKKSKKTKKARKQKK